MPELNSENTIDAKNSFYHFIFKKSIDWLIIIGAIYWVWPYTSSKNLYFLSGKLVLLFCMIELIRRYFITWTHLRRYYRTRDVLRETSDEIPEEEISHFKTEDNCDSFMQKHTLELNNLLVKFYEKDYGDLNDYYKHESADFSAFLSSWNEYPTDINTTFEDYLRSLTSFIRIAEIPDAEKRNYIRISGILLIVLGLVGIYYLEVQLLAGTL
jgi:hypothetical protein